MKRIVDIYIESISGSGDYSKLELFNDEKIDINLSVQNIQDISKVYTDFTQSFTVPASSINNAIFEYFYQSDVNTVNSSNIRRLAYIEIDLAPFRSGKIQLEKSNIKNGSVDSYTITFYGDLISIKDKFANDKLADLDLSSYNIEYTGANIESLITSTDYTKNVRFPLITSKRVWTYNDGVSTDIKTSTGSVKFNELFPALKVARIFDAIENKYGITLNGSFLDAVNLRWDRLFLWLKNAETFINYTNTVNCVFTSVKVNGVPAALTHNGSGILGVTNEIELYSYPSQENNTVDIYCETNVPCNVSVECYSSLTYVKTIEFASTSGWNNLYTNIASSSDAKLSYKIKTDTPATISNISISVKDIGGINGSVRTRDIKVANISTVANISLNSHVPDITVADFFSGILKMFNLTCYATSIDNFLIETLEDFYAKGYIYNITTYTDIDSIDIERVPLYKNISFEHEKSESFINKEFLSKNKGVREYGDTKEVFTQYDNGDFAVKVPFEELLPINLDGGNLCASYSLTPSPEYKSYIPKPVLLYMEDIKSCDFYFDNGTTKNNKTTYAPFYNEVTFSGNRYSLSFGEEKSVLDNTVLLNGLFKIYYNSYLSNLFNPKCRLVRVKAHFPLSLITKLRLNDRLIIRDKRYIINELKSDITSGEVDLTLINDFRAMINTNIPLSVPSDGGTIKAPVVVPTWSTTGTGVSTPYSGVTFSGTTFTSDGWVDITVPSNSTPVVPIVSESSTNPWITEDGYNVITEDWTTNIIQINYTNTDTTGTSIINSFNLFQE